MFRLTKMIAPLALLVSSLLALHATTALAADVQGPSAVDVAVEFSAPSVVKGPATGRLMGTLLESGQPVAGQTVSLKTLPFTDKSKARQATTDSDGKFAFALPRGGAYLIEAAGDVKLCRVWHSNQAPPSAIQRVLLTAAKTAVVRGQDFVSYEGAYDPGCAGSMSTGSEGGFQNCDSDCGQPPRLSNCNDSSLFGAGLFGKGGCGCNTCGCDPCGCDTCGGCGCGGMFGGIGGRSKLLFGLLGGAVIGYALNDDDGPIEATVPAS